MRRHRFFSALSGEKQYPCDKCGRDCLDQTPCIQCSICDKWDHFICSGLTAREFRVNVYHFCSSKCEACVFPFSYVDTSSLVKCDVLNKSAIENRIPKIRKKPPKRKKKSVNSSQRVKFDHFLDINCEYLDPNLID